MTEKGGKKSRENVMGKVTRKKRRKGGLKTSRELCRRNKAGKKCRENVMGKVMTKKRGKGGVKTSWHRW